MKRRAFIVMAGAAAFATALPGCSQDSGSYAETLRQPDFLGRICDTATIHDIGAAWRGRTPDESQESRLVALLLPKGGDQGRSSATVDPSRLRQQLDLAIQNDYAAGKVVTVNGWVLSLTEARQCALYSLSR